MPLPLAKAFRRPSWSTIALAIALAIAIVALGGAAHARVTRIVIDSTMALTGQDSAYEQVRGRAFGMLDPGDPHNAIITDIALGMDADGKVRYETTFVVTKPVDMTQASGFMWHDVPNRGGVYTIAAAERNLGDVGLASGWQADNAGSTGVPSDHTNGTNHWVVVPMAKNADGSLVSGNVLGRIVNRGGADSQPLNVMGNPVPYLPASLDTSQATLVTHTHETLDGRISIGTISLGGSRTDLSAMDGTRETINSPMNTTQMDTAHGRAQTPSTPSRSVSSSGAVTIRPPAGWAPR